MFVGREEVGQRSETVRRANLSAIVRELHLRGPLSRSELVAWTGLTRSAIRSLVGDLVTGDFVVEDAAVRLGTPGRPSPLAHAQASVAPTRGGCRRAGSPAVRATGGRRRSR